MVPTLWVRATTTTARIRWLALICITLNVVIAALLFTLNPSTSSAVTRRNSRAYLHLFSQLRHAPIPNQSRINGSRLDDGRADQDHSTNPLTKLMPVHLRGKMFGLGLPVRMTANEFRTEPSSLTGNPLIDDYGHNDVMLAGELGRGVVMVGPEKDKGEEVEEELRLNALASDLLPLNRMVPDSRLEGCERLTYPDTDLLVSIIVPFHNEWPSVLLRTLYSLVNRTPRKHLLEIVLVDDCSDNDVLRQPLQQYVQEYFPRDLVRLLRMPKRLGLIQGRMAGFAASEGDVIVFLDSHMEVNEHWLPPLLAQIAADRRTVAMSVLDYIDAHTLQYNYNRRFFVRYGFDWRLFFFETLAGLSLEPAKLTEPVPGALMVGAAFAMDRQYFEELGGYDEGMKIWGGENVEMSWRVWMCGGRLVHVPCSHVGHIARGQPYKFPEGVHLTKLRNYKRAAEVWMGPYKKFLYENYPELKTIDAGDLSHRVELRHKLQCPHNFTWYLESLWPVLTVYDEGVTAWGSVVNNHSKHCLDNRLFNGPLGLHADTCHFHLLTQGFSLTKQGVLRSTLHCAVVPAAAAGQRPTLHDCIMETCHTWHHTQEGFLVHDSSGLCLDEDVQGPVMASCDTTLPSQTWHFTNNAPFL